MTPKSHPKLTLVSPPPPPSATAAEVFPLNAAPPIPDRDEGRNASANYALSTPDFLRGPIAFVWRYMSARKGAFGVLALGVILAATCAVAAQYGMKLLVDALAGPRDSGAVEGSLALFLGLIAAETALWRASGWLGCKVTVATGVDIRIDLFEHLTGHPLSYFQNHLAGSLGHRITAMAGSFGALTNRLVWDVTPPVISFLGALVIFAGLDWRLAAGVALLTVLTTTGLVVTGLRGGALHSAHATESGRVGGELIDVVANIWPLKAFSARDRERDRLLGAFQAEACAHRKSWLFTERVRTVNDGALVLTAAITLIWTLGLWKAGRLSAGDVVVVSSLTFRLLHGSRDLALSLIGVGQNYAYVNETLELLGGAHEVADAADAKPLVRRGGSVRLEGVRFSYGENRPVLQGLNLHVPAGQRVGVVGASGAGKSTVLSLLQRMYDPDVGRVLVDGQPLTGLRQDDLRAALAVVPQEVTLFHRSIGENIRFARPDATDDEVRAAARAAFCHDFIEALPEGYDTLVGERGAKLSGGQRQRIGVARAMLKDAPIVLLDEATSALDTTSEIEVQRAIDVLMRGRTVIAVAHRLSTLAGFDRIVVMQDGRVVEDGAPVELRARRGLFDRLWRLQADGLEDPAPTPAPRRRAAYV